jgi:hypothetical protein
MMQAAAFVREPQSFVPGNGPVSDYDAWVAPFVRDLDIYIPGVLFFFAVQHGLRFLARALFPRFRTLSEKDQFDWCIRGVAVANGIICQWNTYLWISYFWNMPEGFDFDMYTPLPGYRVPLGMLISYFIWDFCVCCWYGWSWAYTIHAVASGVGMYLCSFPCSALWSPFFSGVYELSNMTFHTAHMTRAVCNPDIKTGWRVVLPKFGEMFFVLWFFVVRLLGGVVTSSQWLWMMGTAVKEEKVHNYAAAYTMMPLFAMVIVVQFFWAGEVIRAVKESMAGEPVKALDEAAKNKDL